MPQRGCIKADQLDGYPDDPAKVLTGQVDPGDGSNVWVDLSSGITLPGDATKYYDGTGNFTVPAGSAGGGLFGGGGGTLTAPPSQAALTQANFTGATLTDVGNTLYMTRANHSGDFVSYAYKAYPAGNFTFTIGIVTNLPAVDFFTSGIAISDGTKVMMFAVRFGTNFNVVVDKYASVTSFTSHANTTAQDVNGRLVFLTVVNDGTNLKFYLSFDVNNLTSAVQIFSEGKTTFQTPTRIGIGMTANNTSITGASAMTVAHWNGV